MKRFISLLLACFLALTLAVSALAEPFYLEDLGITIEVPEGMTAEDMSDEESYTLGIHVDADENLMYVFVVTYIEEFDGKNIRDLTDEEIDLMRQGIESELEDPQFEIADTEEYYVLVAASGDGALMHYITLVDGWMLDIAVGRGNGPLTDEDIETAADLLFSIEFDEE